MIETGSDLGWLASLPESADDLVYDHKMDISASVYLRMKELGLTQTELAERMGVDRSQVCRILAGKMNVTLKTIARLEDALDFRLDGGFRYAGERQLQAVEQFPVRWARRVIEGTGWHAPNPTYASPALSLVGEVAA